MQWLTILRTYTIEQSFLVAACQVRNPRLCFWLQVHAGDVEKFVYRHSVKNQRHGLKFAAT